VAGFAGLCKSMTLSKIRAEISRKIFERITLQPASYPVEDAGAHKNKGCVGENTFTAVMK
jgi:hypothetical protein